MRADVEDGPQEEEQSGGENAVISRTASQDNVAPELLEPLKDVEEADGAEEHSGGEEVTPRAVAPELLEGLKERCVDEDDGPQEPFGGELGSQQEIAAGSGSQQDGDFFPESGNYDRQRAKDDSSTDRSVKNTAEVLKRLRHALASNREDLDRLPNRPAVDEDTSEQALDDVRWQLRESKRRIDVLKTADVDQGTDNVDEITRLRVEDLRVEVLSTERRLEELRVEVQGKAGGSPREHDLSDLDLLSEHLSDHDVLLSDHDVLATLSVGSGGVVGADLDDRSDRGVFTLSTSD